MPEAVVGPDSTPAGWGGVAAAYDSHIAPHTAQYARAALDATGLRAGQRVLDVAAGTGALALEAARRGAQVLATDFAPEMVQRLKEHARSQGLQVEARVMDGQDLDLPDGSFDAAYSVLGLMFFPSPDRGMAEMRRVLVPGGRAAVVVWAPPERSDTFAAMFGAIRDAVPDLAPAPPPAVFSLADPHDLAARMERAGFSEVHVEQVVRPWTAPSPEAAWESFTSSNPVMPLLLARVGQENVDAVRAAFVRRVGAFVRGGAVAMKAEAHLATGKA